MHFSTDVIVELIRQHGLLIVFFFAIFEGPIISVIAGWFVRLGYMEFTPVLVACIAADLIGDSLYYCVGSCSNRSLPRRLFPRIFSRADKLSAILEQFHTNGGRIIFIAKITHSLGFAALIAAGAARMSFPVFIWFNFLGAIPKSLFFILVGYGIGHAYGAVDAWIWRASLALFVVVGVAAIYWARKVIGDRI
jgi:membrane protein DedA with SNARE-associated domain